MILPDRRHDRLAADGPLGALRGVSRRSMPRRHVLMLVLAVEVLAFGVRYADRYRRPPAATVDPPSIAGHVIT